MSYCSYNALMICIIESALRIHNSFLTDIFVVSLLTEILRKEWYDGNEYYKEAQSNIQNQIALANESLDLSDSLPDMNQISQDFHCFVMKNVWYSSSNQQQRIILME